MKKGFTLLELLIVMAILAILASILLVVVKPQQIFSKARDTQRKSDLKNLASAIEVYLVETPTGYNLTSDKATANDGCVGGGAPTLYYSSALGSSNIADLPAGSGFTAMKLATSTPNATNGTGWVPINFAAVTALNIANLPLDPTNSANNIRPALYYTYACRNNNTYEFNANLEVLINDESNDGGNNPAVYELGTDKTILPATTSAAFYQ